MPRLVSVETVGDIPKDYHGTAIEGLLRYHNLGGAHGNYSAAQLLVGMCMDSRKSLNIPDNFAFVLRSGGANLRYSEFKVSYAIAVGGVKAIALIGHTNCGMVNLPERKEQFVRGLVDAAGWSFEDAEAAFEEYSPRHEIGNEMEFVLSEVERLRERYPRIVVAPLLYRVEDNRLYLLEE